MKKEIENKLSEEMVRAVNRSDLKTLEIMMYSRGCNNNIELNKGNISLKPN